VTHHMGCLHATRVAYRVAWNWIARGVAETPSSSRCPVESASRCAAAEVVEREHCSVDENRRQDADMADKTRLPHLTFGLYCYTDC
jgi:hypothetical protein